MNDEMVSVLELPRVNEKERYCVVCRAKISIYNPLNYFCSICNRKIMEFLDIKDFTFGCYCNETKRALVIESVNQKFGPNIWKFYAADHKKLMSTHGIKIKYKNQRTK
jgi:hypothetical protein